ncbi:methylated-DNA--[protein]-cysteine S-methyltransferase [Halorhodospira abdelmalekii]|uniref:methylated-DNA--[protein]-cysteine S-methyltransferase n=1 Tax=Halorhodospira abdelmalekii TaxID=421629 RepID=UPI0030844146
MIEQTRLLHPATTSASAVIRYGVARCRLGWIGVAATESHLCAIAFDDTPERLTASLQALFTKRHPSSPASFAVAEGFDLAALIESLTAFIEAPRGTLELPLPLDIRGTAFQERVWHALRQIPVGRTVSYVELAQRIGAPTAVRAVAQACAANRLAVAVPCHRVVRRDGALGGYRWGVERKRQLLLLEGGIAGGGSECNCL